MKDVYIFDLDGTLVDSMPYFTKAILSIPEEEGLTFDPTEMIKIVTPLGYTKSAEYYRTLGAGSSVEDMVHRIEKKLVYEYSNNIFTKPGVTPYVKALHEKGARLFVLTASPHLVTDVCLQHNGIFDLFEQVWSVEDFALSKSDTRIFFEVAKTVGCKPEEVHYFDDSLIALANAKKAGYRTYAVYDAQTPEEVERMKAEYDVYVGCFEGLEA